MPSHLSNLGFPVETREELEALLERVLPECRQAPCEAGTYLVWSSPCGAELWLQFDPEGNLQGFTPHFSGVSGMRVRVTERIQRLSALDGGFHAWAEEQETVEAGGDPSLQFPFVFDCPGFGLNADLELPSRCLAQVAGFAHELMLWDSPEAYEKSQEQEAHLASKSFIPTGLLDAQPDSAPQAAALVTGHILAAELRVNPMTGVRFWMAHVRTYGGSLDIVWEPRLVSASPRLGGVVQGMFWLSGQLIRP